MSALNWDWTKSQFNHEIKILDRNDWVYKSNKENECYLEKRILKEKFVNKTPTLLLWNLTVAFSPSYNMPVLYFECVTESGALVTDYSILISNKNNYNEIFFTTHPIFLKPCFGIHPCKTIHWMNLLLKEIKGTKRLEVWLSALSVIFNDQFRL